MPLDDDENLRSFKVAVYKRVAAAIPGFRLQDLIVYVSPDGRPGVQFLLDKGPARLFSAGEVDALVHGYLPRDFYDTVFSAIGEEPIREERRYEMQPERHPDANPNPWDDGAYEFIRNYYA